LKTEQVHHRRFATRAEAKAEIFDGIDCLHRALLHISRRHGALGSRSPWDFNASFAADLKNGQPSLFSTRGFMVSVFEPLQPPKLPLQKKKRRTTDEVFLKIA
jgi:hypothetical protein